MILLVEQGLGKTTRFVKQTELEAVLAYRAAAEIVSKAFECCCFALDDVTPSISVSDELVQVFAGYFKPEGLADDDIWFETKDYLTDSQKEEYANNGGMTRRAQLRAKRLRQRHRYMCLLLMAEICEQGECE